jgi:Cu/Ag efflux protein CusF
MNLLKATLLCVALGVSDPLAAQQKPKVDDHSSHHSAEAPRSGLADGEVRRVDKAANKISIRHGEIKDLNMAPMTMVYQVKDPALLSQVKAGDKIKFRAEKSGNNYTVTEIEPRK